MTQTSTANLVTASDVSKALGIPLYAVYRFADRGVFPFEDHSSEWSDRRRYLFDLDVVRAKYRARLEARRAS